MKAWVLHGVGDLRLEERPVPKPDKGEVLITVKAAGICGSDIPRIFTTGAHRHPLIPGHEFSGIVETVGDDVEKGWVGKRVGVFPLIPCGKCGPCEARHFELCRNYDYLGSRRDGAFAEYVAAPAKNLIELLEGVSFEAAAMLEPMSVAVHAIRRIQRQYDFLDKSIAVCGIGTIGTLLLMFLLEMGCRNVYAIGNKPAQLERAVALGFPTECCCDSKRTDAAAWLKERTGMGADIFFECVGSNECYACGVDAAAPLGTVVLVGNPHSDMGLTKDTYWKVLRNQLTVTGTWNSSFTGEEHDDWHYVMDRLARHSVEPERLITQRFAIEELMDGLKIMRDKSADYCKIMMEG